DSLRLRGGSTENGTKVNIQYNETNVEQSKCSSAMEKICMPCLRRFHPLPENPNICQRLAHSFMLPLQGNIAQYIQFIIICLQIWAVLIALTRDQGLPGGNFFSLLVLFVCCVIAGYLISFIRLPPLLGMLIMGVLLRNVPGVKIIGEGIDAKWSGALRKLALTVILTRAGLGLDVIKLKKLSFAVIRLAFTPCLAEAVTGGIVSHFLLGFPWKWSAMFGCILAALSPAVTVPALVNLIDRRYGVAKGIPTMGLAAGGLDNVLCVTGFAVFFGTIFSDGDIAVTIVLGPIGAIVGVIYGFVMGIFLWYFPAKDCGNPVFYRTLLLFGSGLVAVFGSSAVGLSSAGPLGCLTTATVAAYKWRARRKPNEPDEVANVMAIAWLIVQHFLFGLIGAAVDISKIQSHTAGYGIATLAIGLCVRSIVSFTVTLGTGFNIKERIFIVLTWLSKATVQAAIGGMALDRARESNPVDQTQVKYGEDVLTISVLAIIICAPVGATCMALLGPKFLVKGDVEEIEVCSDKQGPSSDKGDTASISTVSTAVSSGTAVSNNAQTKI
ncbi:hypothetical protein KUTeg_017122, partial [Tegillarca granosa]